MRDAVAHFAQHDAVAAREGEGQRLRRRRRLRRSAFTAPGSWSPARCVGAGSGGLQLRQQRRALSTGSIGGACFASSAPAAPRGSGPVLSLVASALAWMAVAQDGRPDEHHQVRLRALGVAVLEQVAEDAGCGRGRVRGSPGRRLAVADQAADHDGLLVACTSTDVVERALVGDLAAGVARSGRPAPSFRGRWSASWRRCR